MAPLGYIGYEERKLPMLLIDIIISLMLPIPLFLIAAKLISRYGVDESLFRMVDYPTPGHGLVTLFGVFGTVGIILIDAEILTLTMVLGEHLPEPWTWEVPFSIWLIPWSVALLITMRAIGGYLLKYFKGEL